MKIKMFLLILFVSQIISQVGYSSEKVTAATMFGSHWVEMVPFFEPCTNTNACPMWFTAFTPFKRVNDPCGRSCWYTQDFSIKKVLCPAGEVMVGTRFYEWNSDVDEEHEDASCARPLELTFSLPHWVEAPNAFAVLDGGYKEAICPAGEAMIGTNMYGISNRLDEEHIDAYCAKLAGGFFTTISTLG